MAQLNIAKDGAKPYLIDPQAVTGLKLYPDNTIVIYGGPQPVLANAVHDNIDFAEAARKISESGSPLISFMQHWPAEKDSYVQYPTYISPRAVTFATISTPYKDGHKAAIIGVKGIGREENYHASQQEIDTLIDAVLAEKSLVHYPAAEASARWYEPESLYIAPDEVTLIKDDGHMQVFVESDRTGKLDVKTMRFDANEIADQITEITGSTDQRAVMMEARRIKRVEESKLRKAFADSLAAMNGTLTAIPSPEVAVYIHKDVIDKFVTYDDGQEFALCIDQKRTPYNPYPDDVQLYYPTVAERQKAVDVLKGLGVPDRTAKKAGPAAKPHLPKPGPA